MIFLTVFLQDLLALLLLPALVSPPSTHTPAHSSPLRMLHVLSFIAHTHNKKLAATSSLLLLHTSHTAAAPLTATAVAQPFARGGVAVL